MDKREVACKVLPLGALIASAGFILVGEQVQIDATDYSSQYEAIMPQPSIIPDRGFSIKLKP